VLLYEMLAGRPPFLDQLQSVVLVKQATALPPPLVAQCADLPRRLAIIVHTLLAKSPHDRPRSAQEARRMLARSLARPEKEADTIAPFAGTLATVNQRATRASRLIAAATILAALGGLWLVWANSTQLDLPPNAVRAAAFGRNLQTDRISPKSAPAETSLRGAQLVNASAPALNEQAARLIASSAVAAQHGRITEARVVHTERGPAIIAIHEERDTGTTHLFMMEPRGPQGGYRVTGHVPLDMENFSGANWTAEVVDADGDGYEEVLCNGTDARNDPFSRRLVLYVPDARQTYSMRVGADGSESGAVRVKWSANAGGERAKPFRDAMRERALADLPHVKS